MKYTYKLLFAFFLLTTAFLPIFGWSQGPDSVFQVPNNPLINEVISISELDVKIKLSPETNLIPLQNTIFSPNGQTLIKHNKELYVLIEQTGFIYKLINCDSVTCVFKRIDHTVNLNYNIDCKVFFYNNQLYSFGGYGFWKTNGHLRKFNFEDSEWDIIPLDKEIIASTYSWFSSAQGRLYVPFQKIINAGIAGQENVAGVQVYTSYYLDMETHKWVKLGELEKDLVKLVSEDYAESQFLNTNEGLIKLIHDEAYMIDFVHNKLYKSKNADLNQFLIRRASFTNMFIYKGYIYSYNSGSNIFNKYPFNINEFELLRTSIWGVESQLFMIVLGILSCTLFVFIFIWYFNRSVKRKLEAAQLNILKTKSVNQAFTGTELALIELLLSATNKNESVEIHQINHVLGIKDKNIGLQKKVRSDVMNAINDKYEFVTQSDKLLISSSRKEDDKRFFEYFITPSELKTIERILNNA